MISKIRIQNFKSLEDVTLECSNLNVLTGLNGMGKSSVIQALLALRQSYDKGILQNQGLSLKGDLVDIGFGKDALYEFAGKEEIIFHLDFINTLKYKWFFAYGKNDENDETKYSESDIIPYFESKEKDANSEEIPTNSLDNIPKDLDENNLFKKTKFKYLHANRWVNNEYPISTIEIKNRSLGKNGQFTTHFLLEHGAKKIRPELCYPETITNELNYQVSAWMNEISPSTKIIASEIPGVSSVRLRYQFQGDKGLSSEYTPLNVGFGITYVLPVIVALLSSEPGDIIIIENPESHIHPQGQSSIGRLIGLTAQLGIQIFIETHSDHIINGICLAVNNKKLDFDKVKFNYVNKNFNESVTTNFVVTIDENGQIDDSKLKELGIGFFDQIQKDLSQILFENR